MEEIMKITFNTIIFITILTVFGCSEKETVLNPIENPPENSKAYLVEGKIVVEFIDTLSQAQAESFLVAHDLTVYTLYNFGEAPPHSGIIEIPIGQEDVWIDTLRKYPEIKLVGRIGVVELEKWRHSISEPPNNRIPD
jgi:hypothetical protein